MKQFLLFSIRCYWKLIPAKYRRQCIYRHSCSRYVFSVTEQNGFLAGIKALWFRYKNCRSGYVVLPIDNTWILRTVTGELLEEKEINTNTLKTLKIN